MTGAISPDAAQATQILDDGFTAAHQNIGRFNLGLFGMTGVGKSTLVNAVFDVPLAKTGVGEPVTRGAHLHTIPGNRMGIYDTEGLEIGEDGSEIARRLKDQIEETHTGPLDEQIHVIWYCIRASDRRFTDMEAGFIRQLAALGPPILMVMTRTPVGESEWPPDVAELYQHIHSMELPIWQDRVHLVNALPDDWSGTPSHGLEDLLAATEEAAPLGVQRAIVAAQRIDGKRKLAQANAVVAASAQSLELRPVLRNVRSTWAEMVAAVAIIYRIPKEQAVSAALQSRELTSMHRLIYVSQAGVLAAPMRYVYLAGAKTKKTAAKSPKARQAHAWIVDRNNRRKTKRGGVQPVENAPQSGRIPDARVMGSGLAASTVTQAIGEAWIVVCDRAYRSFYPEPPSVEPEVFAAEFNTELAARMSRPLRAWRTLATRRSDRSRRR